MLLYNVPLLLKSADDEKSHLDEKHDDGSSESEEIPLRVIVYYLSNSVGRRISIEVTVRSSPSVCLPAKYPMAKDAMTATAMLSPVDSAVRSCFASSPAPPTPLVPVPENLSSAILAAMLTS
jgi:hypothetical protein